MGSGANRFEDKSMTVHERVLSFIHCPEASSFDSIAVDVFRQQYVTVPPYRIYCDRLGVDSTRIASVDEIPMVSTVAFKYAELGASGASDLSGALRFLTSGTTIGRDRRGCHLVPRPEVYRASALAHLRTMMFPDGMGLRMLAIHPTADQMPESSLSRMISWCIEEFGAGPGLCAADRSGVSRDAAIDFL